ncbi:hypothetical protein IGI04_016344 [Brassica rapa subsp. trilocularis]|uniref:Translation initiation factor 5A C-terminal domain-containing protein n=1 Tax=Brassica rapa subsp. trilocularis TaxID=1813537 RepID=A0ABQ7MSU2_BRACM|nr:hypothetical protein IGI04_016344 [Brassica rapa subsp. trilocularis]
MDDYLRCQKQNADHSFTVSFSYSFVLSVFDQIRPSIDEDRNYDATRAYALSKLANVLHTIELSRILHKMDANVTANCVHPGIVTTRLIRDGGDGLITDFVFFLTSKLLKSAAATTCYVAASPRLRNVCGKYFSDCNDGFVSVLTENGHTKDDLKLPTDESLLTQINLYRSFLIAPKVSDL